MPSEPGPPQINGAADAIDVAAAAYSWRWKPSTDEFTLADADGRAILRSPLQPAVEATGRSSPGRGHCVEHAVDGPRLRARYEGVNGADDLRLTIRFESTHFVVEEATYRPSDDAAVVRLAWFAAWHEGAMARSTLRASCSGSPEEAVMAR